MALTRVSQIEFQDLERSRGSSEGITGVNGAETRTPSKGTVLLFPCAFKLSHFYSETAPLPGAPFCSYISQLTYVQDPEVEQKKKRPWPLNSPKRQNDLRNIQAFDSFITAILKCNSCYKIHSFKWLYIAVQLSPPFNFTVFSSPQNETLNSLQSVFKPSSFQLCAITNLLFVSVTLLILDISCKWNHLICDLFCLVYFTQCNVFKVYLCCTMYQYVFLNS